MTSLEATLRQIAVELTRADAPFALVGGLAVSVRTEPRFTRDADLAVALPTDAEAEALVRTLRARGYGIETVIEQEAADDSQPSDSHSPASHTRRSWTSYSHRRESSRRSWPMPSRSSCCRS